MKSKRDNKQSRRPAPYIKKERPSNKTSSFLSLSNIISVIPFLSSWGALQSKVEVVQEQENVKFVFPEAEDMSSIKATLIKSKDNMSLKEREEIVNFLKRSEGEEEEEEDNRQTNKTDTKTIIDTSVKPIPKKPRSQTPIINEDNSNSESSHKRKYNGDYDLSTIKKVKYTPQENVHSFTNQNKNNEEEEMGFKRVNNDPIVPRRKIDYSSTPIVINHQEPHIFNSNFQSHSKVSQISSVRSRKSYARPSKILISSPKHYNNNNFSNDDDANMSSAVKAKRILQSLDQLTTPLESARNRRPPVTSISSTVKAAAAAAISFRQDAVSPPPINSISFMPANLYRKGIPSPAPSPLPSINEVYTPSTPQLRHSGNYGTANIEFLETGSITKKKQSEPISSSIQRPVPLFYSVSNDSSQRQVEVKKNSLKITFKKGEDEEEKIEADHSLTMKPPSLNKIIAESISSSDEDMEDLTVHKMEAEQNINNLEKDKEAGAKVVKNKDDSVKKMREEKEKTEHQIYILHEETENHKRKYDAHDKDENEHGPSKKRKENFDNNFDDSHSQKKSSKLSPKLSPKIKPGDVLDNNNKKPSNSFQFEGRKPEASTSFNFGKADSESKTDTESAPAHDFGGSSTASSFTGGLEKKQESVPAPDIGFSFAAKEATTMETPKVVTTAPSFNFGGSSSSAFSGGLEKNPESAPVAGFNFGTKAINEHSKPEASSSNNFSFGHVDGLEKRPESAPAPFNFGASTLEKKPESVSAPVTGFNFGASTLEKKPESVSAPVTGFNFGASTLEKKPEGISVPVTGFNFGASTLEKKPESVSAPVAGFNFGAKVTTEIPKTETPAPSFNFGGSLSSSFSGGLEKKHEGTSTTVTEYSFGAKVATTETPKIAAPTPSFNFGGSSANSFSGGLEKTTQSAPDSVKGFNFGSKTTETSAPTPVTGFNFGAKALTTEPSSGFSFGQTSSSISASTSFTGGLAKKVENAPAPATGFNFGASAKKSEVIAPAFNFGGPSNTTFSGGLDKKIEAAPAPVTGFNFGGNISKEPSKPTGTAFTYGVPEKKTDVPAPVTGFNFGATSKAPETASSFNFGASDKKLVNTPAPGFNFGAPAPSGFSAISTTSFPAPSVQPQQGFGFSASAITTPSTSFGFTASTPTTFGAPAVTTNAFGQQPPQSFGATPGPFGGTQMNQQQQQQQQQQGFNFGGSAGGFNAGSGGGGDFSLGVDTSSSNMKGRKILSAKRRK